MAFLGRKPKRLFRRSFGTNLVERLRNVIDILFPEWVGLCEWGWFMGGRSRAEVSTQLRFFIVLTRPDKARRISIREDGPMACAFG